MLPHLFVTIRSDHPNFDFIANNHRQSLKMTLYLEVSNLNPYFISFVAPFNRIVVMLNNNFTENINWQVNVAWYKAEIGEVFLSGNSFSLSSFSIVLLLPLPEIFCLPSNWVLIEIDTLCTSTSCDNTARPPWAVDYSYSCTFAICNG